MRDRKRDSNSRNERIQLYSGTDERIVDLMNEEGQGIKWMKIAKNKREGEDKGGEEGKKCKMRTHK